MHTIKLRQLLEDLYQGHRSVDEVLAKVRRLPMEQLGSACVDHHRELRTGMPEAVFGESKSVAQLIEILGAMLAYGSVAMATRVDAAKAEAVLADLPELQYFQNARILAGNPGAIPHLPGRGTVAVVTAGTSDLPVAEEARVTLEWSGHKVVTVYDVGVAGIHRILSKIEVLQEARVIIVVAGMEGALPSVVAGLTSAPVIGVPTSIGYGVGAGGFAALMGMLTSCAAGLAVVNIDNGYGAACMAAAINQIQRSDNH